MDVIVGFLLLAALGWAMVEVFKRVTRVVRGRESGSARGLWRRTWDERLALLRLGSGGQRRRTAEREMDAVEARLIARLGYLAPARTVLLADAEFCEAVERLEAHRLAVADLVEIGLDDRRPWVSRIALATLARRNDVPETWPSSAIRRVSSADWDYAGLLLLTLEHAPGEVLGPALSKIDDVVATDLAALLTTRVEAGREQVSLRTMTANVPRSLRGNVALLLEDHGESLPESVRVALEQWLDTVPESEHGAPRASGLRHRRS